MKKNLFKLIILSLLIGNTSVAQNLVWAKTMSALNIEAGKSTAMDSNGNIYVTGVFSDTVDFDPGVGVFNLKSKGFFDVFIQKLDPSGNLIWAKSFGGTGSEMSQNIKIANNGDIVISGIFTNTVNFDLGVGTATLNVGAPDSKAFIVRYTASGTFKWARHYTGMDYLNCIMPLFVDTKGNVYFGFWNNVGRDFDPGPATYTVPLGATVLKLDSAGTFCWAKSIETLSYGAPLIGAPLTKINVDSQGNVVVSGLYEQAADLNTGPLTKIVPNYGGHDFFIVKLNCNGDFLWGNSYGSSGNDVCTEILIDNLDDIYFTGIVSGNCDFDNGPLFYSYTGGYFIAKTGSNGNFNWVVTTSAQLRQAILLNNRIIGISSQNGSGLSAGWGTLNGIHVYNTDASSIFSTSLNNSRVNSISVNNVGQFYITGDFSGTANLGVGSSPYIVFSAGSIDAFVSKINYCDLFVPPNTVNLCLGSPQVLTASGLGSYAWQPGGYIGSSYTVNPSATTIYTVTGSTGTCVATRTVLVVVSPNIPPSVTASATSTSVCQGYTTALIGGGANAYSWSAPVYNAQPFSPLTSKIFTVTGTNTATGCKKTATVSIVVSTAPIIAVNSGSICSGKSFTMIPSGASSYTYSSGTNIVSPLTTTSYSVRGTSALGCVGSNTAICSVVVNAIPSVVALASNTLICLGQSVVLTASSTATSYTWNTGATTLTLSVSPTVTSTFTVSVSNISGCAASSSVMVNVNTCTGIEEDIINSIVVYPNPNHGVFTIELNETTQVVITTIFGQVILTEKVMASKQTLDIKNYANGIYFVKLIKDGKQQTIKLIKE